MTDVLNSVKIEDIDDILDEIDENERKIVSKKLEPSINVDWNKIMEQMQMGNANYIKNLITSRDININTQNPENGLTLLHYAIIIGNYDLVKILCNFGADVSIKDNDGDDPFKYAVSYGRYNITELIFYRQLSGSLGNDLRDIATQIHSKNKEAKDMMEFKWEINKDKNRYEWSKKEYSTVKEGLLLYMKDVIGHKKPFSSDLLFYAWYFISNDGNANSFDHDLWKLLMKTYESILSDTSDKIGWEWLKGYIVPSLIWFLPHPTNDSKNEQDAKEQVDDGDDMEPVLKKTLFWELLWRVRKESKSQSDILLKEKIDTIKQESADDWNQLISYNVTSKWSKNARQDVCGCIDPVYLESDLSEDKYPPSTHFSAKKHYDTNIYLNELLFRANILDDPFQRDMKYITKEISEEMKDDTISYRAGPVKTLTRSQAKVENDYINEDWPTSAKILDINRCAIQFKSIKSLMKFLELFTNKINNNQARSLKSIIRCKNGWSVYNPQYPQYTDVKLNVLMENKEVGCIITEIQFLLSLMSSFKKKAHKLYSIDSRYIHFLFYMHFV